jgi:predicted naringenin-chalcone synthase
LSQYLTRFTPQMPDLCLEQQKTVDWLEHYLPDAHKRHINKFSVSADYIHTRYFYSISGVGGVNDEADLFDPQVKGQPSLSSRSNLAQTVINDIFQCFYRDEGTAPDDLLHVSCTHYQSPSGPQLLAAKKEWNQITKTLHLYHMGCYASLPAIRVARGFNATGSRSVDIVHTELCSFHLDRDDCSVEQIIMKTLFADGAIKYSSLNESGFKDCGLSGFKVLGLHEEIIANSENEMSWRLSSTAFLMTLSRSVPKLISASIENFMIKLFKQSGFNFHEDKQKFHFAIHPGGPEIIQLIQKNLNLEDHQVSHSSHILRTRGNISSATLPHIWDKALQDESIELLCSVAFGPGLTMTGAVFQKC